VQSFLAEIHVTEVKANEFATQYANELKNRMWKEAGVPPMLITYAVSKITVNVYVMALANKLSTTPERKKIQLNRFTPGFAKTEMHDGRGNFIAEQSAVRYGSMDSSTSSRRTIR
jgi:short-subunit dehydrogenase